MENKIRQVNTYRKNLAVADPDETDLEGEVLISSVISDSDGNETERITWDSAGNATERVLITYNNNHPVEEMIEMDGEQAERTTREFDADGRLLREFRHYLEGDPDEIVYTYDANGHVILQQLTDGDGDPGEKHQWVYENNLLVREESYNEFGNLEFSKTYSYSEDSSPEEVVELNFTGDQEVRHVTLYDDEGRIEVEKRYDSGGRLFARSIYSFDEKGNTTGIEEETVSGKSVVKLEYDEAGNNTVQEETGPDGSVVARIFRTYNADNQPVSSEVRMENTAQRMGQHYRLRYEYLFFG